MLAAKEAFPEAKVTGIFEGDGYKTDYYPYEKMSGVSDVFDSEGN